MLRLLLDAAGQFGAPCELTLLARRLMGVQIDLGGAPLRGTATPVEDAGDDLASDPGLDLAGVEIHAGDEALGRAGDDTVGPVRQIVVRIERPDR